MKELVDFMKKRSRELIESARIVLREGYYDTAAFLAGYATKLYLEAVLLDLLGEYPRLCTVRDLFVILRRTLVTLGRSKPSRKVQVYIEENSSLLAALNDAYMHLENSVTSYEREEAERILDFAKEVINFIKVTIKHIAT
ncbi:MAG: hypothetical protein DRJ51_03125 [Thermoprotei archaeon]|nr:MAG: hypothetical protein DRJ51_03125 [Thermoprotei archaeon]RLF02732.1 MAG: hypothetical protein DRJ59_02815 [Thermoprotei archaeon]